VTKDDIIRMAREAGSIDSEDVIETVYAAFAAAEAEKWARDTKVGIPTETMEQEFSAHHRRGYEAGKALIPAAVAAEREAIAQKFDGPVWSYDYREIAAAIRARNNT
jgi:hypothetical protein